MRTIYLETPEEPTLQEIMEKVLSWYYNKEIKIEDGIITVYVLPDGKENISFVYEVGE